MSVPKLKRIKSQYNYDQQYAPVCWSFAFTRLVCHIIKRYTSLGDDECGFLYTYPEISKILLYDDPSFLHTYTPDDETWMLVMPTEPMDDQVWVDHYISRCSSENGFKKFLLFCAIFRLCINYSRVIVSDFKEIFKLINDLLNNKKTKVELTLINPTEKKIIDNQSVYSWNITYIKNTIDSIFKEFYEKSLPTFKITIHDVKIGQNSKSQLFTVYESDRHITLKKSQLINKMIQSLQSNFYIDFSPNFYVTHLLFFIKNMSYSFDEFEYIELFLNPSIVTMYLTLKKELIDQRLSKAGILVYLEKQETIEYVQNVFEIDQVRFRSLYMDLKLFFETIDASYDGHSMLLRDVLKNGNRILFECINSHGEHYSYYIPLSFLEKSLYMIDICFITDSNIRPQTILSSEKKQFVPTYIHDLVHTGNPIIPIAPSAIRLNAMPMRQQSTYGMDSSFQVYENLIGSFKTGSIRDDRAICKLYCLSRMVLHTIKKYIPFGPSCDYSYSNLYSIFKDQLSKEELDTFPIENMVNPHALFEPAVAAWRGDFLALPREPKPVPLSEWESKLARHFSFNGVDELLENDTSNPDKDTFIQAQIKKKYKCNGSSFSELLLFADIFRLFQKIEQEPIDEDTKIKYMTRFVSGLLGNHQVVVSITNQNEWKSIYIQESLKKTMAAFYRLTQRVKFSVHYIISDNLSFIQPVLESDSYIVLETQKRVSDMIFDWLEKKYSEAIFLSISSAFNDKPGDATSHFWILRQWKGDYVECIHSHLPEPFDLPILFLQRVSHHVSFYMISDSIELDTLLQTQFNPDLPRSGGQCKGETYSNGQCVVVETYGKRKSKRLRKKSVKRA